MQRDRTFSIGMLGRAILWFVFWTIRGSMSKVISTFELSLHPRSAEQTLANWLYSEVRKAILDGRLKAGAKLPASRDFARRYRISRGTVVSAFERLQDDGYLSSRVGIGTWVNTKIAPRGSIRHGSSERPAYIRRVVSGYSKPKPFINWVHFAGIRPFGMAYPAVAEFPVDLWGRIAGRRARGLQSLWNEEDKGLGYRPLREAIAHYLGSSRGVRCSASQIVIVSGVQQALDLLFRLLLKPGDPVWMEDPGYFGAAIALGRGGARIIPVPVDEEGLSVSAGISAYAGARGVFLTPTHQYPLGMSMPVQRRMELLQWAAGAGAFIIEDDYDSEFQFDGLPAPALQSLDQNSSVIFVGTFNKLLFPSLRLGYIVFPQPLVDVFASFRRETDFHSSALDQAVLCDFIHDGHLGRHLRRMRNLYGSRLETLIEYGRRYLSGLLEISNTKAGLYTVAFLNNGMSSHQAEAAAAANGLETRSLDRFTLKRPDPKGLLLGFAAFEEKTIRRGITQLAAALDR